jgi:predicted lipoprotein with Yx(FWY)xxD motif
MKRIHIFIASLLAATASGAAVASAQSATVDAHAARTPSVELRHTKIGTILTTASGLTLYEFSRDHGSNSCVKVSGCAQQWPALETSGAPTAGAGVRASLLSTIKLGSAKQITYAGHPLYTFAEDKPGSTSYVGAEESGGKWYALSASGGTVK